MSTLSLDMRWHPGAEDCTPADARLQSHAIDEVTIVLRQNPCVDSEAPLMYLLIGTQRALLIDSGASERPADTDALTRMVASFLVRPGGRLPLVVAHTHGHQDHRAGDAAFASQPDTIVVPYEGEGMRRFFGITNWPDGGVRFELGNRPVELVPTPGHHPDHVAFIDSRTALLFSGDFLLPGRLVVDDIDAYRGNSLRLLEAVQTYGVAHALGAHIEMNSRGELYSSGATIHPDEHGMAMNFGMQEAQELRQDLEDFNGFYSRHPNYTITNPMHNLVALGAGVVIVLAFTTWLVRRLRKGRRTS